MLATRWCIILVVVAVWWKVVEGQPSSANFDGPAPCSNLSAALFGDKLRVTMSGTRAYIHALSEELGQFDEKAMVGFQWTKVKEMVAIESGHCVPERDLLLRELSLADCMCTPTAIHRVEDHFEESGYEVKMHDCPSDPQFVASAYVTIANSTKITFYDNTLPHSSYPNFTYTHPAGGMKLGFRLQNWTWTTDPTYVGSTYLTSVFDFGFASQYPTSVGLTETNGAFVMESHLGRYRFLFTLDMGLLLDGFPSIVTRMSPWFPISLPTGTQGNLFPISRDVAFCEPVPWDSPSSTQLRQWGDIYYDPSLTVLFDPIPIDPTMPPSSKKTWVIAVAVAVPILTLLVLAGVLLLAAAYVPAVRVFFRPFSKVRAPELIQSGHTTAKANNDEWTPAQKPVQ